MNRPTAAFRLITTLGLLLACNWALAVTPVSPEKSAKAKSKVDLSQVQFREIPYAELEHRIDSRIVVHTTNQTVRSGILTHYTKVSISLRLGPEVGSIELSIPSTSVRKVLLELGPADPLFIDETAEKKGETGAKKN